MAVPSRLPTTIWMCSAGLPDGATATSPIKAASLEGAAPAIVVTAECDVLHDDGLGYAEGLRRAGVPVEYREYPGMIHGFLGMMPVVDDAMNAQRAVWDAFNRAFA